MINVGQPSLGGNEKAYIEDVLEREWLTMGHYVLEFEARFARYIGVKHAIATKSGTSALHLSLAALGIGPGDEVIVPALTFVATANAVSYTGAKPVIADVDEETWTLDYIAARDRLLNNRTRAILPVSLYGLPGCFSKDNPLPGTIPILDDACEALGAEYDDVKAGALGRAGCFSFYGNKTITTGEGGMVTTNDDELAAKIRHLRSECTDKEKRFWHDGIGFNYVMTDLQAAVGCAQMEMLGGILERRAEVAERYHYLLDGVVTFQKTPNGAKHGNWSVAVLLPEGIDRDDVMRSLKAQWIETRPMFYPLNLMPMYYAPGTCPVAERLAQRGMMLPTHAELAPEDVHTVCEAVKEAMRVYA